MKPLHWTGILLLLIMASCSGSTTQITDTISEYNRQAYFQLKQIDGKKTYPESLDLLGDSAVAFSIYMAKSIPPKIAESIHRRVSQQLSQMNLYHKFLSNSRLNELLNQNSHLAQAKDIYLDSLAVVSVSDKDISNPLGNYLQVQNFLVFQLDQWPCHTCDQKTDMRMKLKLVDAESSFILWTGIVERRNLTESEAANPESIALDMVQQLTHIFYQRFVKKWHRQRFDNLKKSVS